MAEKKNYYIKVQGTLVEVTEEVYTAYYRMGRRELGVEERDQRNSVMLYSELDNAEMLAIEMFADKDALPVDEQAISRIDAKKLRKCVLCLSEEDQKLIVERYWKGETQTSLAEKWGVTQQTISYRERKILLKLKNFLKN